MRTLVLGGYGLIGASIVERLLAADHSVTAIGRSVGEARRRWPQVTWAEHDIAALSRSNDWRQFLDGIDAVVNCAGALQDGARDDLRALQSVAMRALFEACDMAGIRRVVQISAAGASAEASTAFMRTKAEADAALAASDLEWTILRPGLVLAPAAYGATALLRALASMPLLIPLSVAGPPVQTVHVDDVADAVLLSLDGRLPARTSYDLVEHEAHSLSEVVAAWRSRLGHAPAPVVVIPGPLGRVAFRIGDALSMLGWRSPLRTTALRQIEAGVIGDPVPWMRATGRRLSTLPESLLRLPATVQERWFGRLWLLKPLVIATLSGFWIASALVGLYHFARAASILTAHGVEAGPATLVLAIGIVLDLCLGVAIVFRGAMRWAALGMVATTAGYLVAGTIVAPELWGDPLGPFVKTVPGALLALVAWALADER